MADLTEQTTDQAITSGNAARPSGVFARATQHLSIRGKILLGFLNIIVLIILIAIVAMAGQHFIVSKTDQMLNTDVRLASLSLEAHVGVEQMAQEDMAFRQSVIRDGLDKARAHIPRFLEKAAVTQSNLAEMVKLARTDEMKGPSLTAV